MNAIDVSISSVKKYYFLIGNIRIVRTKLPPEKTCRVLLTLRPHVSCLSFVENTKDKPVFKKNNNTEIK